ncbi:MAG: oligosaccharide flippase family protein [Candidatus Omnitrophica bacterium]|nr:oligosaccharide flippase family protein [Candidatus Omnitrophota bacterium]
MGNTILKEKLVEEISVVRGTFYGSMGVASRIIFLFLANLILARSLGPASYGVLSLVFLIVTLGNAIVIMGLDRGLSRFIGRFRADNQKDALAHTVKSGIVLSGGLSILFSLLLFIFSSGLAAVFGMPRLSWMLKIISFTFLPAAFIEVVGSVFQGYENIKISRAVTSFIPSFLWFFASGLLVFLRKATLLNFCLYYVALTWLSGIVAFYFLVRSFSNLFRAGALLHSLKETAFSLFSFCLPLLLFNFLALASVYVDSFLIGYFLDAYKVGIYQVAFRIARLSPFVFLGLRDVFIPLMSRNLAQRDLAYESINETYVRVAKWVSALTFLIIITIMVFSDFFVGWFGKEYLESSLVLKILLIAYLVYSLFGPTEAMNIALGSTRFVAGYTLLSAVTAAVLNWIIIPRFGIIGASWVAVVSIAVMKLVAFIKLYKINRIILFKASYTSFIVVSFFGGLLFGFSIFRFINTGLYGILLFIPCFAVFEVFTLKKLGLIDQKDLALLKLIFIKGKSFFAGVS